MTCLDSFQICRACWSSNPCFILLEQSESYADEVKVFFGNMLVLAVPSS